MRYQELYEARAVIDGVSVLMLKNPTPEVLFFYTEGFRKGLARGVFIGDDVYFWDGYFAEHAGVEEFFGLKTSMEGFDLADRGDGHFAFAAPDSIMPKVETNPCLKAIINHPRVEMA
jgi:hypothetical protein